VLVAPSSPMPLAPPCAPSLTAPSAPAESAVPEGLLCVLAEVTDRRDPRGVRYRLATLLAIGVCAMSTPGHNSLVAMGECARRCTQRTLFDLGCPYDPLSGRVRCPDEKTLRDAYADVDPGELTRAGYQRLAALARNTAAEPGALTPQGLPEREATAAASVPSSPGTPARCQRSRRRLLRGDAPQGWPGRRGNGASQQGDGQNTRLSTDRTIRPAADRALRRPSRPVSAARSAVRPVA
jgi:hypothetical protein